MQRDRSWHRGLWASTLLGLVCLATLTVGVGDPDGPAGRTMAIQMLLAAGLAVWLAARGWQQQRDFRQERHQAAARDAVLHDRLEVAAELHDILSHGLGAITLRARAGALAPDLSGARAALTEVGDLSRDATDELRRLLELLRGPDPNAPLRPLPGIADLRPVVDRHCQHGLVVPVRGLEVTSSPQVEALVHRVVREALVNTMRHAGPTTVDVTISDGPDGVAVRVVDQGPVPGWAARPGAGRGLALLDDQLHQRGGHLEHGRHGSGHLVEAWIPERVTT